MDQTPFFKPKSIYKVGDINCGKIQGKIFYKT